MKKNVAVLLFMALALLLSRSLSAQVVIIANPSVKASDIKKSDLRDIFSGSANTLSDGGHVVPILLKGGSVHEEFLQAYIGKPDSTFRAAWRSLVFSGQASMPKSLESEAAVVEYVSHTSGAIGYVGKATQHEGVKVLAVR